MSSGSSGSTLGTSDIIGIAIGGVFIVVMVIGLIFSCYSMCCKKKPDPRVGPQPEFQPNYGYPQGPYGQQMNTGYYGSQPYPNTPWNQQTMPPDAPPPYQTSNTRPNYNGKF